MSNFSYQALKDGTPLSLPDDELREGINRALKEKPDFILAARNGLYIPLLKAKQYQKAKLVLLAIYDAIPENSIILKDLAILHRNTGEYEESKNYIFQCLKLDYSESVMALSLQICLLENNIVDAARLAEEFIKNDISDPRLIHFCLLAFYRARKIQESLSTAQQLMSVELELAQKHTEYIKTISTVMSNFGQIKAAKHFINSILKDSPNLSSELVFELARISYMENPRNAEIEELLNQDMPGIDPNRINDLRTRHFLCVNNLEKAQNAVSNIPDSSKSSALLLLLARTYKENDQLTQACAIYEKLFNQKNYSSAVARDYTAILMQLGQNTLAQQTYDSFLSRRNAQLPASFEEGLEKIQSSPNEDLIPEYRVNWILSTLKNANRTPENPTEFIRKLHASTCFDHFLLDWLECKDEQRSEVIQYIQGVAPAKQILDEALKLQKGAFIATAHVGSLYAGPVAFHIAGIEAKWLASVPDVQTDLFYNRLISTSGASTHSIARKVMQSLKRNQVIAIAIDGNVSSNKVSRTLFDQEIQISDFIPKLAWKQGIPSFFPLVRWDKSGVSISLEALPVPGNGESLDAYTHNWCDAFMKKLESMFLNYPESLRGTGGFWTHIRT